MERSDHTSPFSKELSCIRFNSILIFIGKIFYNCDRHFFSGYSVDKETRFQHNFDESLNQLLELSNNINHTTKLQASPASSDITITTEQTVETNENSSPQPFTSTKVYGLPKILKSIESNVRDASWSLFSRVFGITKKVPNKSRYVDGVPYVNCTADAEDAASEFGNLFVIMAQVATKSNVELLQEGLCANDEKEMKPLLKSLKVNGIYAYTFNCS